jgi:hypothetical protein
MALSFIFLTLKQNMYFYNNDMTDMIFIYGECGKNTVAVVVNIFVEF